jgi:hypothetical protein
MILSRLNINFTDADNRGADWPLMHERFVLHLQGRAIPVYLVDTPKLLELEIVHQIASAMQARTISGMPTSAAVCIVNHQAGLNWEIRGGDACAPQAANAARRCGISVVATSDLIRAAKGIEDFGWDVNALCDQLLQPGQQLRTPPAFVPLGRICRLYEKAGAMSVDLEPARTLRQGDKIAVRLPDRFFEQSVESPQMNRSPCSEATGVRVGIGTRLGKLEALPMAEVFLANPPSAPRAADGAA